VKEGALKVVMQLKGASGGGDGDSNPSAAAAGGGSGSGGAGAAPGSGAAALKRAGIVSKAAAAAASGKVLGARPNFFDVEVRVYTCFPFLYCNRLSSGCIGDLFCCRHMFLCRCILHRILALFLRRSRWAGWAWGA